MSTSASPSQPPYSEPRKRTTSAKRLLTLLVSLKGTSGTVAYRVLPTALNLKATSEQVEHGWAFAEGIALISKMLEDFELEISTSGLSDDEQAFHRECRPLVITAMAPVRMGQPWDQVRGAISDKLITKLEGADVTLRRSVTELMLEQVDLRELRESVATALEGFRDSLLPKELKEFVVLHLVRIRTALDEYEFRGLAGLNDALAGYLGSLATAKDGIRDHTTEPQQRKLTEVLTFANGVITLAHSTAIFWPQLHAGFATIVGLLPK